MAKKAKKVPKYQSEEENVGFKEGLSKLKHMLPPENFPKYYCSICKETVKVIYTYSEHDYMLSCNHSVPKEWLDKNKVDSYDNESNNENEGVPNETQREA